MFFQNNNLPVTDGHSVARTSTRAWPMTSGDRVREIQSTLHPFVGLSCLSPVPRPTQDQAMTPGVKDRRPRTARLLFFYSTPLSIKTNSFLLATLCQQPQPATTTSPGVGCTNKKLLRVLSEPTACTRAAGKHSF